MHGFPHAVKDLGNTAGIRTTLGSPIFRDNVPHDGRDLRRAPQASRRDHHRQDEHAGVRARLADLQHGLRHHAQRVRPDADGGRQQRRRGRGRGAADGAGRRRQRLHGLAAQPGRLEQHLRLPALDRAGPGRSDRRGVRPEPGLRRSDGPHRDRCRPAARRSWPATTRARRCRSSRTRRSSPAPCAATSAAPGSRSSGTSAATCRSSRGARALPQRLRGVRADRRGGGRRTARLRPGPVWDSFTKLRYWLIGGLLFPFYNNPARSAADEAGGPVRGRADARVECA